MTSSVSPGDVAALWRLMSTAPLSLPLLDTLLTQTRTAPPPQPPPLAEIATAFAVRLASPSLLSHLSLHHGVSPSGSCAGVCVKCDPPRLLRDCDEFHPYPGGPCHLAARLACQDVLASLFEQGAPVDVTEVSCLSPHRPAVFFENCRTT